MILQTSFTWKQITTWLLRNLLSWESKTHAFKVPKYTKTSYRISLVPIAAVSNIWWGTLFIRQSRAAWVPLGMQGVARWVKVLMGSFCHGWEQVRLTSVTHDILSIQLLVLQSLLKGEVTKQGWWECWVYNQKENPKRKRKKIDLSSSETNLLVFY